jgi:FtsP/CotA-like multicopper oxidase with cupredoxin domain
MSLLTILPFIFALVRISFAGLIPRADFTPIEDRLFERQTPDSQCTNTPMTRSCWGNGFSIATNYDSVWPTTGKTVKYTLEITNTTMNLDGGRNRTIFAVNGQYPGPAIRASWGDTLQIKVKNSLKSNGTSIHWHGIRQYKTNHMDGTNGITECPLAPGETKTYEFLCTQFGTSWYHSHYSDQYSDGVVGPIIIDGPATSNYDFDLGAMPINDYYYRPAFELAPLIQRGVFPRGPPSAENILINGTNVNRNGTGKYHRNTLTKGKKYRLRLINTSTNDNFKVGLDGHDFTVITADFVPVRPFITKWLFIGIGERYDVIINANQAVDSYWFHVVPQTGCSSNQNPNAVSIFSYAGATSATPSDATRNNAPPGADCADPNAQLVPYVKLDVPSNATIPQRSRLDVGFAIVQNNLNQTLFQWNVNTTA